MKKKLLTASLVTMGLAAVAQAHSVDLLQVYNQAVFSDPTFKQARANYQIAQQNVPLNLAVMLPQIQIVGSASYDNTLTKGTGVPAGINPIVNQEGRLQSRTTGFDLTLTQSIFNYTYWQNLASAKVGVKSAFATYTAAIQDLIQRTASDYFDILDKRAILIYNQAEERAFYRQYKQALESYRVGVKTLTDVDNAKAAYDSAKATVVSAKNNLMDSRENLRTITGVYYRHVKTLKRLPLVVPTPKKIDAWVEITQKHNWSVIADRYSLYAAHYNILSAEGGHLPTVDLSTGFQNNFQRQIGNNKGYQRTQDLSAELDVTMPIYQGGQVNAQVDQNIAQYRLAASQLETTYRTQVNTTRQSYLGVESGISKIRADYQSIISNRSSVEGTEEGYKVGTQTMLNVLQAEQNLYQALQEYSTDRFAYINDIINLKEAAGTLSIKDIGKINQWLYATSPANMSAKSGHNVSYEVKPRTHKPTKTIPRVLLRSYTEEAPMLTPTSVVQPTTPVTTTTEPVSTSATSDKTAAQ